MKIRHLGLLAFYCLVSAPALLPAEPMFDQWADGFGEEWARTNPQFATRVQYFTGAEQDGNDRKLCLGDAWGNTFGITPAQAHARLAHRGLRELDRFARADLTPAQRTSVAVIRWTLENCVATAEFAGHRFVFEQIGGLHLALVEFLTTTHPVRRVRDVENYLARLAQVAGILDQGIAEAKAAAAFGMIPPRFILQRVIDQLDSFLALKPADNPLVLTLGERMSKLADAIPAPDRARFTAQAEREVSESILPAVRRIRSLLAKQLPQSGDEAGLWRLPRGPEAYHQALLSSTTTALGADEIHEIGLREVARIEAEMDQLLRQLGDEEGPLQARLEKLNQSRQPPLHPDPRPRLLEQLSGVVQDAERRAAEVFDLRPKARVVVRREPALSEGSAAAHYSDPAPDGSQPGIYWVPLADLGPKVTWTGIGLKSTAYHEAIPGHHFQVAIQQESTELPRYRKLGLFGSNDAYVEGWALYAERLAEENGWYANDVPGKLGYLQLQLFRARRLVVDTGLHTRKWTRQQVIDYGFTPQETERYVVWPGQACSYMIGQLQILALREHARHSLGAGFSLRKFHNRILAAGSLPLAVLAQEVEFWIQAEQASN